MLQTSPLDPGRPAGEVLRARRFDDDKLGLKPGLSLGSRISALPERSYNGGIMKAISIKLSDPLFQDLARRAEASASSQSDIVRNALQAYLQAEGAAQPGSCAERAVRWTGIVEGPTDLSTNPEHLRNFGR